MENQNTKNVPQPASGGGIPEAAGVDTGNRAIFSWETPEYIHHEKDKRWFMIAGAVVLLFVLIGIFTGSASMAIAFILLGGVYYITQQQKPRNVNVIISEMGVHFGPRFYPYNTIQSFWILYNPPHLTTLNLRLNKGLVKIISIELTQGISPGDLRDYLLTQVPEQAGKEEGFVDALARKFKL